MRVGIDVRELEQGKMTGIGRYLRNFITYASRVRPDYKFFLYGNQHTDQSLQNGNIVVRIAAERRTLWWDQMVLPQLARADRTDVFLSPYIKGPGAVDCPLVTTIHDLMFLVFPEYACGGPHQRLKNILSTQIARWVNRRAALILTDSEYSREDIKKVLGLTGEKIQVLPLGVDETYQPVQDESRLRAVRQRYGIRAPYIFYLGNFKPHKNVQALLRAFAILPGDLKRRCQLVLGGRFDHWQGQLGLLAHELSIAERTLFIGQVEEEDMPALYSGAEVFVFPSLYEEFSLPPFEAMACGTAVVSSNRTSLPEVVGAAGRLIEPLYTQEMSAAIGQVLEDESIHLELARKGFERARLFRSADICEEQMSILEKVVAGNSP